MTASSSSSKASVFLALSRYASLAVIAVVAHLEVLAGWWKIDDPQILLFAIRHSPFEALFSPEIWRTHQTVSFAPLQPISFDFDYGIFGINAAGFYAHQILAVVAVTLLAYRLLEHWTGVSVAFLTAAAIAASPAMTLVSESLMIRHYLEGVALALAAIIMWRSSRDDHGVATAALYLLATLAKEVCAPLPLLFIADGLVRKMPSRRIARRLLPTVIAAAVYLIWRRAMLGTLGGYGEPTPLAAMPAMARALYGGIYGVGPTAVSILMLIVAFAALGTGLARRRSQTLVVLVATAIMAGLPLLGVSGLTEMRYGFVPVIAVIILTGLGLSMLPRRIAIAGAALLFVLQIPAGRALHRVTQNASVAGIAEGRYIWTASASASPLLSSSPAWYLTGLRDLRELSGRGSSPGIVFSRHALLVGEVEPGTVVRVTGSDTLPRALDPTELRDLEAERLRTDPSLPITVDVEVEDFAIVWKFGPVEKSRFEWISVPNYDSYPLPATGSHRVPTAQNQQRFRIRRDLPDGRWTISPVLDLPANGDRVTWPVDGHHDG